jgi:hypothetical protein
MRAAPIWALNAILALVVVVLFRWPVTAPPIDPRGVEADLHTEITPGPTPALDDYAVITDRPLFNPDRRPPPPPAAPPTEPEPDAPEPDMVTEPPPPPPPEPPVGRLHGVIGGSGAWIVIFQQDGDKVRRLKEGEDLDGWRIVEVQPNAVVFAHGDDRHTVPLRPEP